MKIGDSVGNRFIKSNPNFHTKKLTITLLFGGKMTQKVVLPLKCTKAPNVKYCTMDLIAKIVARIIVCTHLMVFLKFC